MTEAPLRANPEDRPLPPSGGNGAAAPSGAPTTAKPSGAPTAAKPSDDTSTTPPAPDATAAADAAAPDQAKPQAPAQVSAQAVKRELAAQTRPIGSRPRSRRDWRRAWSGFLIGVAALAVAIGLTWVLWDQAGAPPIAEAPAEQLTSIDLAEMEALLDGLGFPPGKIDGAIDSDGAAAIRDFQETAGLPVDGAPSMALLEELRAAQVELSGGQ